MKYIFIILICFLGLTSTAQVQKQPRSNFPTVVDSSLAIGKNFILPVFRSFSQLATYTNLDSSGRLVFIRDSNAVFYRTNAHTWAKLSTGSGSGSVAWGSITGTLSNQTDLQTVLDSKVDSVILRGGDSLYNHYATGEVQFIGLLSGGSVSDTLIVTFPLYVNETNDTLSIPQASTDSSGYLSASDWNYFAVKPDSTVLNATGDTLLSYLGSTVIYSHAISGGSGGTNIGNSDLSIPAGVNRVLNLQNDATFSVSTTTSSNDVELKIDPFTGNLTYPGVNGLFTVDKENTQVTVNGDVKTDSLKVGTTSKIGFPLYVVGDGTNTAAFMNGNVGIGTTTPAAKLQITATDSNILRLNPSGLWAVGATTDSLLSIDNSGRVHKRVIPTSGSGTVTSVATGYGLSGGTITTSGTLLVDSAALSLKYLRRGDSILKGGYTSLYQYNKGKDSLQTNINLKANIASPTFTGTLTADSIKPLSIIRFPQTAGAIAQSTAYISFDANSTATTNGLSWGFGKGIYSNASNALTIAATVLNVSGTIVGYAMQATGAGNTSLSLSSTTATLGKSNADANTGVIISNSNASATGNIAAFSSSISGTSLTVSRSGLIGQYGTATAGGTTGAQTINKPTGTVNFAAGATSLVVTNSLVSTSTPIICVIQTNDLTMTSIQCVPGSGSFTIYSNAAATGETKVYFEVKAIN